MRADLVLLILSILLFVYLVHQTPRRRLNSRLLPAEAATADPGTDCATANPHVTNTPSVSPGDFVWNF